MVGVISTSHIIRALNLEQQGTVLNENFPAVALVQDEVPKHPVRIYQGEGIGVLHQKSNSKMTKIFPWQQPSSSGSSKEALTNYTLSMELFLKTRI